MFFVFWLCGSIILGVSIWLRVSENGGKVSGVNIKDFLPAINLLIAVGSIVMVLGFLGCCGAMKESKCMLILFFIGLLLILVLQITAGILGALNTPQIATVVNDAYKEYIPLNTQPDSVKKEIGEMQQEIKCCGLLNGYSDWGNSIPTSCNCTDGDQDHPCVKIAGRSVWAQSCIDVMIDILKANCIIIIGIAFGLAVIEIFGLAFSMTLYCQIKNK
ncbi:tetraspanin-8-like isoform X2 [Scyliorhinus canicula]|uniref:tetraspanin-8-like isoform X2 n=1 Tax=Scyliorhinus canicula TaxID=7830 RepID=UPI0018F3E784|nr:tetraspanin-8-like isoform X2 [Scyliorhinus canicula]